MWQRGTELDRRSAIACAISSLIAPKHAWAQDAGTTQIADFGDAIDVSEVAAGAWSTVLVNAQPIFLRHRSDSEIAAARSDDAAALADPARDEDRAPDAEWLTVSGLCTHAGCTVSCGLGAFRGWLCLCHGSVYDLSGRVRAGPAKRNLAVVRHHRTGHSIVLLAA
jgi:ubiquinol-cytochrome c reductase iron-sulfur subunit